MKAFVGDLLSAVPFGRNTSKRWWRGLYSDEICKLRRAPWECLPMVTGSRFGASRLPQNLGSGQKDCPDRNILEQGQSLRDRRRDDGENPRKSKPRFLTIYAPATGIMMAPVRRSIIRTM